MSALPISTNTRTKGDEACMSNYWLISYLYNSTTQAQFVIRARDKYEALWAARWLVRATIIDCLPYPGE
jgi:hypothetical protein